MKIDKPTPDVIASIESAVAWFENAKLTGIRYIKKRAPGTPKGWDKVVVQDPRAPPLWGRFYNIQTNRPIFCSRDGVPKKTVAEISYERRNGYSWLGGWAEKLLDKEYPAWRKKHGRDDKP
jgi:PelA/Pel-15E family pectate lyase